MPTKITIILNHSKEKTIRRTGTIIVEDGKDAVMHQFFYADGQHHRAIPNAIQVCEAQLRGETLEEPSSATIPMPAPTWEDTDLEQDSLF